MAELLIFGGGITFFTLQSEDARPRSFTRLLVSSGDAKATLSFDKSVDIPEELYAVIVDTNATPHRLKSLDEIATSADTSDTVARRITELRQRLAQQKLKFEPGADAFFGLPGTAMKATLQLELPFLSAGGGRKAAVLTAEATLDVTAEIALPEFVKANAAAASLRFGVRIEAALPGAEAVLPRAAFSFDVPDLPSVGWTIPTIAFPSLTFDKLDLPAFQPIGLPLPEWFDVTIDAAGWSSQIAATGSSVKVTATADPVTIKSAGKMLITVRKFSVSLDNGTLKVAAESVETTEGVAIDKTIRFGGGTFPIQAELTLKSAEIAFAEEPVADDGLVDRLAGEHEQRRGAVGMEPDRGGSRTLTIAWIISRLAIEVTDNPDSRIALKLTLVTKSVEGALSWEIKDAALLDLGGDILIAVPKLPDGGLDGLRPVVALIKDAAGAAEELVRRIARIVAALAGYAGEAAGAVAGFMSELAEQAGEMIAGAIAALAEVLKDAGGGPIAVELRLDARTLRPVQVIVSARTANKTGFDIGGSVLALEGDLVSTPAIVVDLRHGWYGLMLLHEPGKKSEFTLSTNLWFEPQSAPTSGIGALGDENKKPLMSLKATVQADREIIVVAIQNGKPVFFQSLSERKRVEDIDLGRGITLRSVSNLSELSDDLQMGMTQDDDVKLALDYEGLKDKIVSILPKGPASSGALGDLAQSVQLKPSQKAATIADRKVTVPITATIKVSDFVAEADLELQLDLKTLHVTLDGDEAYIKGDSLEDIQAFGLTFRFAPDKNGRILRLAFEGGDFRLELVKGAKLDVVYNRLATRGEGLVLTASRFGIGRGGLDLEARTTDTPVRLAGLEQPFRFTSGSLKIEGGKLTGGTLSGAGPLPPALVGEAVAEIDLVFGARDGRFTVVAANAKLEKEGEPLYSTGTRFRVSIDALGLDYRNVASGGQHFFFLLWGEAAFEPAPGEFSEGLFKNLRSVALKLEAAPLTGDARELLRHIEFQVEIDPPVRERLFDTFAFELRGIGFHPASDLWSDRPPAIGLSGEIAFLPTGSAVRAEIDVHMLWLTLPDSRSGSPLPRVRADGLSVLVSVGGVARIEATAIAVDGKLPTLYAPDTLPANVTADGFLASGRVDISGLGAYGGAMGFLELAKENESRKKTAAFMYFQAEKLAERIDTPIGPLWVREAGAGLGLNYTLAGIAEADRAKTPRDMVRALDKVSKRQGNLANFNAWTPQYEPDALTFALRGMISMTSASPNSSAYNAKKEREIPNPLLMDIVLAVRSDLTFFVNARGWIATNYNDWYEAKGGQAWKERPSLRGYLYFSVPRRELLARFVGDPTGVIGKHPELPEPLVKALTSVRYSSTLYIRPGLFHKEFGWPYELGFDLGDRGSSFWLSASGGLVFRIEDATALYGIAFRASGGLRFEGRVGGSSFGASVAARAEFALGARFIAYMTPLNPRDTLFYGEIYLNLTVSFSVSIWLSFKIFRRRITLRIGFSIAITISIAAELVVASTGVGARVRAAVGVRGFGRSLMVGVGFSFNDGQLERARARVARFMELGLGIDPPRDEALYAAGPTPEPARHKRAVHGDAHLDRESPPPIPKPPSTDPDKIPDRPRGDAIGQTNFWALVFAAGTGLLDGKSQDRYLVQLIPKDRASGSAGPSTFYAEPYPVTEDGGFTTDDGGELRPDYVLEGVSPFEGVLSLWHLGPGGLKEVDKDAKLFASLRQKVGEELILNSLLETCFLASPNETEAVKGLSGEPHAIDFADPAAEPPKPPRDAVADQAGRFARAETDAAKINASLDVEERRSTLITLIGESAFDLAERLRGPDSDNFDRVRDGLEARDFGLTFVVAADELDKLFPGNGPGPRKGEFKVKKRIRTVEGSGWKWGLSEPGIVELLLHPSEGFDAEEPRLDNARVETGDDGLLLCWDLEPAFGASGAGTLGFVEDPETHLAYYEIERSFEGTDVGWTHRFRSRTSTPCSYKIEDGKVTVSRRHADMHLADDLSQGGIPEDFRALILGVPIPSGRDPREVWRAEVPGTRPVSIVYKVTAVDQMGTRTTQRVLEHPLKRPRMPATAPLKAELSVVYSKGQPAFGTSDAPAVALDLVFADVTLARDPELEQARAASYLLRIRRAALKGGGQYGSDAVDDAKSRPGAQEIADRHPDPDIDVDLELEPDRDGPLAVGFLTATEAAQEPQEGDADPARDGSGGTARAAHEARFRFRLKHHQPEEPHKPLLEALGLAADAPGALRAVRVFVQRCGNKGKLEHDSAWVVAETQLFVAPQNDGEPFSATVELLEKPVRLDFPALHRSQLRRQAGRLELLYPAPQATLGNLLPDKKTGEQSGGAADAVLRRLDPDRRSAIRLEFNALGAELRESGGLPEDIAAVIGGFDIFQADPARLRVLAAEGLDNETVAREARRRATVKVLPRSLAGLFPAELSDFQTLEARYPSDARRGTVEPSVAAGDHAAAGSDRPLNQPWYSRAETLAVFPMARLRRSLFPHPEEAMISALLDNRKVIKVTLTLKKPKDLPNVAVDHSEAILAAGFDLNLPKVPGLSFEHSEATLTVWPTSPATEITAAGLRAVLRDCAVLGDGPAGLAEADDAYAKWRRAGADPAAGEGFAVRVEVQAEDENKGVEKEELEIGLAGPTHPVLEETLSALAYERYADGDHPGQIYRAYEVVREAQPKVQAKDFDAFVNATGAGSDPYGWGALRGLGLAAGFRVYDVDKDSYLSGQALLQHVDSAFKRAIGRYVPQADAAASLAEAMLAPGNIGAPFVELVDLPEAYMAVSSFDGRAPSTSAVDARRVIDGSVSILQIALRPRPAQQFRINGAGAPVRYYLVTRTDSCGGTAGTGTLAAPKGMVLDLQVLASIAADTSPLSCAEENVADWLFGKDLLPGDITIPKDLLDRIGQCTPEGRPVIAPGITLAVLRAVDLGGSEWTACKNNLVQAFGADVAVHHVEHPRGQDGTLAFSLFDPLPGPILAALQVQSADQVGWRPRPFDTLLHHLPPGLAPDAIGWGEPGQEDAPDRAKAVARALQNALWTDRFLSHGSGQDDIDCLVDHVSGQDCVTQKVKIPKPLFALVSLTAEEALARVPDANGVASTFFVDPSGNGRELFFAVRPFGRYAGIETHTATASPRQASLAGGFRPEGWQEHFVAVSLPRTRPLQKPAILSAARPDPKGKHADEVELIVARTPDQIVGTANITAERALQPGWTGIELRAGFPGAARADRIAEAFKQDGFDWSREFLDPAKFERLAVAEDGTMIEGEILEPDGLTALRERAPDAWRGAIRYGFRGLPHFFSLTALAHQSAGVVVSDVSAVPLPEAAHILRFPPFHGDTGDDPRLGDGWGRAGRPGWRVTRAQVNGKPHLQITFDLPLARNLDLMDNRAIWSWTSGTATQVPPVFRLPDAATSYRITAMSADLAAGAPQIEVLPGEIEPGAQTPLYQPLVSGDRLTAPAFTGIRGFNAAGREPAVPEDAWTWRVGLAALAGGDVPEASYTPNSVAVKNAAGLAGREQALPEDFDAALWARWAPRIRIEVKVAAPDTGKEDEWQDEVDAFRTSLKRIAADPDIDKLAAHLQDLKPEDGGTPSAEWSGTAPLGLRLDTPGTKVSASTFGGYVGLTTKPTEPGFAAPGPLETVTLWRYFRAIYPDASTDESALLREQRARWLVEAELPPFGGHGSFPPVYTGRAGAVADLASPFVSFELRRFDWIDDADGPKVADIEALALALEAAAREHDAITLLRALDRLAALAASPAEKLAFVRSIELPVAQGVGAIVADRFQEHAGAWRLGYHAPPSSEELGKIDDADLRTHFVQLLTSQIFGAGTTPRFTAFRGNAPATSVAIGLATGPEGCV